MSEIAIQRALSEKVVSRLEIPIDVMTMPVKSRHFMHPIARDVPHLVPPQSELEAAAALLRDAKRPTLLCGIGCRGAEGEVITLSERLQAAIVHTLRSKDLFDGRHEHVVGLTGLVGTPPGYHAVLETDLLLMMGSNFPYEKFLPVDVPIIQIDSKMEKHRPASARDTRPARQRERNAE